MVHYPFFPIFVHDNGGDKLNMNINDDFYRIHLKLLPFININ